MAVLIRDKDADRLIRELAGRTGETITDAVRKAVAERLERTPLSAREMTARRRRLSALLARADAMPTLDTRSADEILGYTQGI